MDRRFLGRTWGRISPGNGVEGRKIKVIFQQEEEMKKLVMALSILLLTGGPLAAQQRDNLLRQIFPGEGEDIVRSYENLSQMVGQNVVDSQGNTLGQVRNIVIGEQGGVNYLIISSGYQLGAKGDQRLIPIPWNVANPQPQNGTIQINVSRERINEAPGFRADAWPNFADPEVEKRVHGYFEPEAPAEKRDPRDLN
jgi:sporulation protein YlmC with PRC-barrel domain